MRKILLSTLLCLISTYAHATRQDPDRLIVGKDTLSLYALPLSDISDTTRLQAIYKIIDECGKTCMSTGCYRQYIGVWSIKHNTLYFQGAIDLHGKLMNFGDLLPLGIPATWFSGELRAGKGGYIAMAEFWSMEFREYETFYTVKNGEVTGVKHFHNTIKGGKDEFDFTVASEKKARKRVWKYISRHYPEYVPQNTVWLGIDIHPDSAGNPMKYTGEIQLFGQTYKGPIPGDDRLSRVLARHVKPTDKLPVRTIYDTIRPCEKTFSYEPIRQILIPDEDAYLDKLAAILRKHHPEFRKRIQVTYLLTVTPDSSGHIEKIDAGIRVYVSHIGKTISLNPDDPCVDAALDMLKKKKKIPVQRKDGEILPWRIPMHDNRI